MSRKDSSGDRILAAIDSVRGIPTGALETWMAEDVSDPDPRPDDLDVTLHSEGTASLHAVLPLGESWPARTPPYLILCSSSGEPWKQGGGREREQASGQARISEAISGTLG